MKTWVKVVLVLVVIVCLISYLTLSSAFPGLFMSLRTGECFLDLSQIEQPFCDQKDVEAILRKVNSLKKHHKKCRAGNLYYLGTPSYLTPPKKYPQDAHQTMERMAESFRPLYDQLKDSLEQRLGKKCTYPGLNGHKIALPGFHLFPGGKFLSSGWRIASMHVDAQYHRVTWPTDREFDQTQTISFTLALSVPPGAGIYFFDAHKDKIRTSFPRYRTFNQIRAQKVEYRPGYLYLHDGHHYHMISEFYSETQKRITLQGHGLWCKTDQSYWLYW